MKINWKLFLTITIVFLIILTSIYVLFREIEKNHICEEWHEQLKYCEANVFKNLSYEEDLYQKCYSMEYHYIMECDINTVIA